MKSFRITAPPQLDDQQKGMVDAHSLVNVLNVISLQLAVLDAEYSHLGANTEKISDEIRHLSRLFHKDPDPHGLIEDLQKAQEKIISAIGTLLKLTNEPKEHTSILEIKDNVTSFYTFLSKRLAELALTYKEPDKKILMSTDALELMLKDFLGNIEKHANGKYRFTYDLAEQKESDYYIDLKIRSNRPDNKIWIPLKFKDVMIDLLANARKFTKPGGAIALNLDQQDRGFTYTIEDNGCGIPEDELEKVFEFGYRASNARDRRTLGGGFGLTKAAWLVLSWGGTFQIRSRLNEGTSIQINLPEPAY